MIFAKTPLADLMLITPQVFEDDRGYFFESYNQEKFQGAGLEYTFIQDNQSYSEHGTIRGLHFQKGQAAQAKLVRVLAGSVLDVAVDIRPESPTFGKHFSIELSEDNKKQLLVPRGFAHGFSVLSKTAVLSYKCDNGYDKASEGSIIYNDKDLNIDWRVPENKVILSSKDKEAPSFKDFKACI